MDKNLFRGSRKEANYYQLKEKENKGEATREVTSTHKATKVSTM